MEEPTSTPGNGNTDHPVPPVATETKEVHEQEEEERQSSYEIFKKTCITYKANCSIAHTQLCHQIWVHPQDNNQVFFVNGFVVQVLDALSGEVKDVIKLKFAPQSMCVAEGHIAACGSRGELVVLLLSNYEVMFNAVTTQNVDMNNAVNIGFHRDQLRLAVASNDNTVKVFSLKSYERVHSLDFSQCMNYASVSPDGLKLVAVGDCPEVAIFSITEDMSYQRVISVPMSSTWGCCFSSDWDATSTMVAVVQQSPGLVKVWRYPDMEVLATLEPSGDNECRSVKFYSPKDSGLNLLVFSERTDQVQVLDIDSGFKRKQILTAPRGDSGLTPKNRRQKVSGFTLTSTYDKIYIGKPEAIYAFEKMDPYSLKDLCIKLISRNSQFFTKPLLEARLTRDLLDDIEALNQPAPAETPTTGGEATKEGEEGGEAPRISIFGRRPFSALSDEEEELFEEFSHYLMSFRRYRALNPENAATEGQGGNAGGDDGEDGDDGPDLESESEEDGSADENYVHECNLCGTSSDDADDGTTTTTTTTSTNTTVEVGNSDESNFGTDAKPKPTHKHRHRTSDSNNNNNADNNNNNNNFRYNVRPGFSRFINGKDESQIRDLLARLNMEIRLLEAEAEAAVRNNRTVPAAIYPHIPVTYPPPADPSTLINTTTTPPHVPVIFLPPANPSTFTTNTTTTTTTSTTNDLEATTPTYTDSDDQTSPPSSSQTTDDPHDDPPDDPDGSTPDKIPM